MSDNTEDLSSLFGSDSFTYDNRGEEMMMSAISDPTVSQICINRYDRVWITANGADSLADDIFPGPKAYIHFLNRLLSMTDVSVRDVEKVNVSVIEGSFDAEITNVHGSIHIATKELTRGEPVLTIRKQPRNIITLEDMLKAGMLNSEMVEILELAMRGRSNILISGGSGAGKTTLARALSQHIDPSQRVLTAEEIDELHLGDRLPNIVSLTTYRKVDEQGKVIRTEELEDLVRHALRMRAARIWVGETRGREAYALVKACNSGHDGSCTTLHADDAKQAVDQLTTYVMEAGLTEIVARTQIAKAFDLAIQISKGKMGKRVITEITEISDSAENDNGNYVQKFNQLFQYDFENERFVKTGEPSRQLLNDWARNGVNYTPKGYTPLYGLQ